MQNAKLLLITLVGTLVLVFGATWVFSQLASPVPGSEQSLAVSLDELVTDEPHAMGAQQPQHTIVAFSDFLCPACAASAPEIESLVRQYPDKIRYVHRQFPLLSLHPQALVLAQVSEAAADQGKFWELHDQLFANQSRLENLSKGDTLEQVWSMAANVEGLDVERLKQDWEQPQYADRVQEDLQFARQYNLSYTPSLFLDGKLMRIDQIKAEVESSLQ